MGGVVAGSARYVAVAAVVLALLTACGQARPEPPATATAPSDVPSPTAVATHGAWENAMGGDMTQPRFLVRNGGTELELFAHTFCVRGGCVDGFDDDPPSVGSPAELFVFVPFEEFDELIVTQRAGDDGCTARSFAAQATALGDGWWRVESIGPAAPYGVELFARGNGAGDMIANLRWTTPFDRALPEPRAGLSLIADHDGRPDSYGLDLGVSDLATTPAEASATVTVTAGNGRSTTIRTTRVTECVPEGSVSFTAPLDVAQAAAALGPFPFTERVELTLDGVTHVATVTFPDDHEPGDEPAVPLDFDPPLD